MEIKDKYYFNQNPTSVKVNEISNIMIEGFKGTLDKLYKGRHHCRDNTFIVYSADGEIPYIDGYTMNTDDETLPDLLRDLADYLEDTDELINNFCIIRRTK